MRLQPVPYLKLWFSVFVVLFIVQGIDLCSAPYRTGIAASQKVESISVPGSKAFPESITSTSDGALFVGRLGEGGIVRIKPSAAESTIFVRPGASGSRSILGVFAEEASSTLWACSNDLAVSRLRRRWPGLAQQRGSARVNCPSSSILRRRTYRLPCLFEFTPFH